MHPVCSFCGASPVAWFEGPDFTKAVASPGDVRSDEAWLACSACTRLLEADDREGLVIRSAQNVIVAHRVHFDRDFWSHRDRA